MSSWRDVLLKEFVPNVSKLTLVADPDCLLTEERLAWDLRERGFDLIEFDDPVAFRYAYESQYRSRWDRGEHSDLVVILRAPEAELDALPYDLRCIGRKLSFNLGSLFPRLSYPVVAQLNRSLLDRLFDAQLQSPSGYLGDNATKDFILRYVFGIELELVDSEVDLLRLLLRLHYGQTRLPTLLAERLVQVFQMRGAFTAWPLAEIILDDAAFYAFLQENWLEYLSAEFGAPGAEGETREPEPGSVPRASHSLPFGHQDIRVYIDNLFLEGKLTPAPFEGGAVPADHWARCGVAMAPEEEEEKRVARLFEHATQALPRPAARHSDWLAFALKWAELSARVHCGGSAEHRARLGASSEDVNRAFADWLAGYYAGLINLPPNPPAMLHQVPRCLARDREDSDVGRVALIVVDGLALDQWATIRRILREQDAGLRMRESAVFAWIPTLTSVSRQALFAGSPPLYFPAAVNSTSSEERLWQQFWERQGLSRSEVAYRRGLGDGDAADVLEEVIHVGKTRVVGLVVDKVDKIMHGMQLGSAGMHNQIGQWCRDGYLVSLIGKLLDNGFAVWLTSDHGNIQCEGGGRPAEGVLAETRGERVRVYPSDELRAKSAGNCAFAREWQPVGLPPGYFPLLAGGQSAFAAAGEVIVGHGGASIEEVVVPLVRFAKKGQR